MGSGSRLAVEPPQRSGREDDRTSVLCSLLASGSGPVSPRLQLPVGRAPTPPFLSWPFTHAGSNWTPVPCWSLGCCPPLIMPSLSLKAAPSRKAFEQLSWNLFAAGTPTSGPTTSVQSSENSPCPSLSGLLLQKSRRQGGLSIKTSSLTVLAAASSRSGCQHGPVRTVLPVADFSLCPRRGRGSLGALWPL